MLRYLDEVVRQGSIRKAAAHLNVAASSVNRQILGLEEEIGVPLFDRLPNRLRMTSAGEMVIAHVRRTLHDLDRTQSYVDDLRGARRGELVVATMGGLGSELLARALIEYRERRPWVNLVLHRMPREQLLAAVRDGDVHLGFAYGVKGEPGFRSLVALDCPIGAVMAPDNALAGHSHLKLADLAPEHLILPSSTMALHQVLAPALTRCGFSAPPAMEASDVEVMRRLAMLNGNIALLNRLQIEAELQRGELAFVPLSDGDIPASTLQLVESARATTPVLSALFAEAIGRIIEELYVEPPGPTCSED